MSTSRPDNPAGEFDEVAQFDPLVRDELIDILAAAPHQLRQAVDGLLDEQLDTKYRNWTIRQIAHHVADSHLHSYIRFKWSLTEDNPTIKAYEEGDWVQLEDCLSGEVDPPLRMLEGLHVKWVQVLRTMREADFEKTFFHPQSKATVTLWSALNYYPWHCRHHTRQILWLREHHGW